MLSQRWKVCVLIVCIGSLLWSNGATLPPTTSAAGADVPHCTDSVTATQRDSTTDQDQVSNDYEAFVWLIGPGVTTQSRLPLSVVPKEPVPIGMFWFDRINPLLFSTPKIQLHQTQLMISIQLVPITMLIVMVSQITQNVSITV